MKVQDVLLVVVAAVVWLVVNPGDGIICYECTHCGDPFQTSMAKEVECNGSCITMEMRISKTKTVDLRYCHPNVTEDTCNANTCSCNSDLCNGGNSGVNIAVPMVTVVAVITTQAAIITL